jgi:MFS family permease
VMTGAQVVTRRLYPVIGPRRLMFGGLVGIALSTALMSLVGLHTNLWWMRVLMFTLGYAMAHVLVSMQAAAFATVPPEATGRASMVFNAVRQLGSAVGVAVLSTVVITVGATRRVGGHTVSNLSAYHDAFLTASAIALIASAFALGIHDADAAATMTGRRRAPTHQSRRNDPAAVTTGPA